MLNKDEIPDFKIIIQELEKLPVTIKEINFEKISSGFKFVVKVDNGVFNIYAYEYSLYIHYKTSLVHIYYNDDKRMKELKYLINEVTMIYLTYKVCLKN